MKTYLDEWYDFIENVMTKSFKDPKVFMPLITVIIFFILGFSFNLWNIAWLAFLLIPIVSILKDK